MRQLQKILIPPEMDAEPPNPLAIGHDLAPGPARRMGAQLNLKVLLSGVAQEYNPFAVNSPKGSSGNVSFRRVPPLAVDFVPPHLHRIPEVC